MTAAAKRGWKTKETRNGNIEAEYSKSRKYMARVNITYNKSNYSIEYLESTILKYDGTKIQRTYNSQI
mgnify:CR=1 FL=1